MEVLGWFLIVVGALFLLLGLIGACRAILKKGPSTDLTIPDLPWGKIIEALLKEGAWGVCTVVGVLLIAGGLLLVAPEVFSDDKKDEAAALAAKLIVG